MTRSLVCAWTLIALVNPAAPGGEDFIPAQALHDAGLVKFWQLQVPLERDQRLLDAYLVDDQLYLGTQDGYVYVVDAYTGVLRWLQPVTRSGYRIRRPCHAGQWTIFVTPIDIQVYERRSGDPVARRGLRFPSGTPAITDGHRFFVGGIDHRLYAFNVDTQYVDWRTIGDGPIVSTPVISGKLIITANDAGTVYACTRGQKAYYWHATTYGPITADLVADEKGVYVASRDQSLYLLDLMYGRVRWQARFGAPLYEPPFLGSDLAFQYSEVDGLVAVETGQAHEVADRERWRLPSGRQMLAAGDELAFVRSRDDEILVVRMKDGTVEHSVPAAGFTLGIPSPNTPAIYLAAPDGQLFCARPLGVPFLQREDVLAALRPAGTDTEEVDVAEQPTTQPAPVTPDYLSSQRGGAPIGGKSKVSREFREGRQPE